MAILHGPFIQSSSLPETEHLPESDGKPMAEKMCTARK